MYLVCSSTVSSSFSCCLEEVYQHTNWLHFNDIVEMFGLEILTCIFILLIILKYFLPCSWIFRISQTTGLGYVNLFLGLIVYMNQWYGSGLNGALFFFFYPHITKGLRQQRDNSDFYFGITQGFLYFKITRIWNKNCQYLFTKELT